MGSGGNRMDRDNWQRAGEQILADSPAGTSVSMTTADLASHPHSGHTDAWEATKNSDGSVSLEKGHYE